MARKLPPVDVVLVGFGWTAAILGQELTDAGLQRARARARRLARHLDRFRRHLRAGRAALLLAPRAVPGAGARDADLPQQLRARPRCRCASSARSCRRPASAAPASTGTGRPGASCRPISWRAATTRSATAPSLPEGMTIQDWGVTYDELEPYYDKFEYLCGISGKAGNLKGKIQDGGNPFEGARSREYPNPPMDMAYAPTLFAKPPPRNSATSRFPARPPTCRAPTPIRSACSSGPAPIAASARNSAAATIPRRARRPPSCRC